MSAQIIRWMGVIVVLTGCAGAPSSDGVMSRPESENPLSLVAEAYRYEKGQGVERDPARAFALYKQAAHAGLADAQYQVGLMYELGIGVEPSIDEAQYWYQQAIGQGFCPGELRAPEELVDE